jgi:hypothetical protein
LEAIMPEQLVTVGSYGSTFEANLVKGKLEAFDVDAVLADENMVQLNSLLTNMVGGVKVRVPQSKVAEARRILGSDTEQE